MSSAPVVVIGAGIGGLCAALELQLSGVPVVLCERADVVGGKLRQLWAGDRPLDAGPTVFTMRWVFDDLFAKADLTLEDVLVLHRTELLARHSWSDHSRLDLFADVEQSVAAIAAFAGPQDAAAYRAFVRESARIFDTLDHAFMRAQRPSPPALLGRLGWRGMPALLATRPFVTLWRALEQRFRDPRLRQLFARYATYTGSSPYAAPATLMLIAEAERRGVWQLEGGMQALANALAQVFTERGGDLRLSTPVAELEVEGDRLTAVRLGDGARLAASAAIFNGDAAALRAGLLGADAKRAVLGDSRSDASLSAVTWGLQASVSGWELAHHTVLFGDDYADEFASIFQHSRIARTPTVYLCAQDRIETRLSRAAPERIFLLMNAPARALSLEEMDACEQCLARILAAHGLTVAPLDSARWRQTPGDFAARFPASQGALYGRATHGAWGSFARSGSRSRVKGFYLAGASVHPGAGVPMVATSGRLAAHCLLSDRSG
jgi:1-hydroxycarotenoid 3,4-desaturase